MVIMIDVTITMIMEHNMRMTSSKVDMKRNRKKREAKMLCIEA